MTASCVYGCLINRIVSHCMLVTANLHCLCDPGTMSRGTWCALQSFAVMA